MTKEINNTDMDKSKGVFREGDNDFNKHVVKNINKLEEWSRRKYGSVLYDSEIDGKDGQTFRDNILNHGYLYFIVIDSKNNVFGHYHPDVIERTNTYSYSEGIFLFTLNNNGRCGIRKFNKNKKFKVFTIIYD